MKKLLRILKRNIVNVSILLILLVLTGFFSHILDKQYISQTFENSMLQTVKYTDFMARYYQIQSDWLIFWLTALTFLTAITGIGIPFILGQSYREKIKEMECEFSKQIKDIDYYKKMYKESLNTIKSDIENIKNQAGQSRENIQKTLSKELEYFKADMQDAIDETKKESINAELSVLLNNFRKFDKMEDDEGKFATSSQIIEFITKQLNLKKFPRDKRFISKLKSHLENAYYSRGLIYLYNKNKYDLAAKDFQNSLKIEKEYSQTTSQVVSICLLECYIYLDEFDKASKILNGMENFYLKDIKYTLDILENKTSRLAENLLKEIQSKIIQS